MVLEGSAMLLDINYMAYLEYLNFKFILGFIIFFIIMILGIYCYKTDKF